MIQEFWLAAVDHNFEEVSIMRGIDERSDFFRSLGPERLEFRANDDGEPSATAGKPILGQINSRELTDILIVVIRYYGGVNLGTGGLIVAYRTAAADIDPDTIVHANRMFYNADTADSVDLAQFDCVLDCVSYLFSRRILFS